MGVLEMLNLGHPRQSRLSVARMGLKSIRCGNLLAAIAFRTRLDQRVGVLDLAASALSDMRLKEHVVDELMSISAYRLSRTKRWVGSRQYVRKYADLCSASGRPEPYGLSHLQEKVDRYKGGG